MRGTSALMAMMALTGGMGLGLDKEHIPYKYEGDRVGLSEEELEHVRTLSKKERKAYMKQKREECHGKNKTN